MAKNSQMKSFAFHPELFVRKTREKSQVVAAGDIDVPAGRWPDWGSNWGHLGVHTQTGDRWSKHCYRQHMERRMWLFDWHIYIWPWLILKVKVKVMHILLWISRKRWEKHCKTNGRANIANGNKHGYGLSIGLFTNDFSPLPRSKLRSKSRSKSRSKLRSKSGSRTFSLRIFLKWWQTYGAYTTLAFLYLVLTIIFCD